MKKGKLKRMTKKASYLALAIVTFFTQFNLPLFISALSSDVHYDVSSVADPDTSHIESEYTGNPEDDGKIWTDKTVTNVKDDEFDITLSAVGQSFETKTTVNNNKKIDVVFILDVSGSMQNSSRYINMTRAVNSAIGSIMKADEENRIGIVTFSDNSNTLLPLDSYYTTDGSTSYLSATSWGSGKISTTDRIRDSKGNKENSTIDISGGTYTQKGMDAAKDMFEANQDTKERVPVVILLSDGIPTYGSTSHSNIGAHNLGNGSDSEWYNSEIGDCAYHTILTGFDTKEKIQKKYNNTECKYYTIGLDINDHLGTTVLNPTAENLTNLSNNGAEGDLKRLISLDLINNYQYVDKAYSGSMSADQLNAILEEITSEITTHTTTPIDTRTVTFTDVLGDGMEVKAAPTVIFNGKPYKGVAFNPNEYVTQYYYNDIVTNSAGEEVSLKDLLVEVTEENGIQTITFQIPKNLFPFLNRTEENPETSVNPIRLVTRVGLSDEAVKAARTGDVFYTNKYENGTPRTTVSFSPVKDNPYYYSNISYDDEGKITSTQSYQNKSLNKEKNATGTSPTYYHTEMRNGVVTTTLGNNGKITLIDPQETTEKTVYKDWQDSDNQDGLREDVQVELYANGEKTGKTATLTEDNDWQYTFTNLKKYTNNQEINYTVKELTEIPGYETSYSDDGLTITNSHEVEKISKSVEKVWYDNDDQDGLRPESVEVQLYANGTPVGEPVELNSSNSWKHTYTNLDKNEKGKEINYTSEVQTTSTGNFRIINTHTTEKIAKTAVKEWNDGNNQDGLRPDSIEVELYANGEATGKTATLSESNNWRYTFNNLERNKDGQQIEYSIKEITKVDGYTSSYGDDKMTIVNSHTPETTQINVVKEWNDKNNQDGIRPNKITVTLFANGEEKSTKEITASNDWETSFTNLPKYANGKEIDYTITEKAVNKYELTTNKKVENTITLINTYAPETTQIKVNKVWKDNNDQDGIRPDTITVQLYKGDTKVGNEVTLSETNDWEYTYTGLDKFENGNQITYRVEEVNVPKGYTNQVDGFTITNTHITDTKDIPVEKVWVDENNLEGFRPTSITVELREKGSSKAIATLVLNANNNWKGTFHNVDVNKAGQKIDYEVVETNVSDKYVPTYKEENGKFIITNTRDVEMINYNVAKTWDDNNDQDGIRPDSISVQLYQNGVAYGNVTTISANDNWTYEFTNLPKYKNGDLATYTVEEVNTPNGYISSVKDNVITNTHTPETTQITVNKVWDDNNNQDGIRPNEIVIHLLGDGQIVKTVTLTEGKWSTVFENLPVYKDGKLIEYEVKEANIPTGYNVSYNKEGNAYTITNVHTPEKTSITAEKVWNDQNNYDGIRSDSISVELLANGNYVQTIYLSNANNWKEKIGNLDKYVEGKLIDYTLSEITKIDGYETTYSSDTFTIVNNHRLITVTKTVDKQTIKPGEALTYTITVSNDGNVEETNIVIVDKLDKNLEFISSAEGTYDKDTHTVTYVIDSLQAGEKKTFILITKVKEDIKDKTVISNSALVLGNDNDKEVPSNEVTTTIDNPPTSEVITNPETSDNINIILLTSLMNLLMLGYLLTRKIKKA